jgi:hypothetical protein
MVGKRNAGWVSVLHSVAVTVNSAVSDVILLNERLPFELEVELEREY